jgi:hypothetical protein
MTYVEILEIVFRQYLPASDLVTCRLVSKAWKQLADARLVGPCMMFKTDAELVAVKDSVSLFAARELALALREATEISGDIARFIATLCPLNTHDRVQRIGAQYETDKISCVFHDVCDRERPWKDLQPDDCDNDHGSVYTSIKIRLVSDATLCLSLFPSFDLDTWFISVEIGNVQISWPEANIEQIKFGWPRTVDLFGPVNMFQTGDYATLVASVELARLAFLHEGVVLHRPRQRSSDDTKHIVNRVFDITGI